MILQCYVDDRTLAALEAASQALGRSVTDLAEAAIAEAAIGSEQPSLLGIDLAAGPDLVMIGVHCACGADHSWKPEELDEVAACRCACGRDLMPAIDSMLDRRACCALSRHSPDAPPSESA